jgi:PhnB protein
MTTANVYLNFAGNCEEAFNFYKSVFGGEFPYLGRYRDMPATGNPGGEPMHEAQGEKIMHVSLQLSKETAIMGSDAGGEWAPAYKVGNNFAISLNTDSRQEAERLYLGLSAGGIVIMPMGKTFWGDYFGMFTDKFSVNWMISFSQNSKG